MFRLRPEPLFPDDAVVVRAFQNSQDDPSRSPTENWCKAVADITEDEVTPYLGNVPKDLAVAFSRVCREAASEGVNWSIFYGATSQFLDTHWNDPSAATNYFRNFTYLWTACLDKGLYANGDALWRAVLLGVKKWESDNGKRVHKGAAFYYWALNQIFAGNLQHGFLLMHEALAEDVGTYGAVPLPPTPAVGLALLDPDQQQPPLAQGWIKVQLLALHSAMNEVANHLVTAPSSPPIDIADFRSRYAASHPVDRVYLLSYALAIFENVIRERTHFRSPNFGSQLVSNAALNLAILVERSAGVLQARVTGNSSTADGTIGGQVRWLSQHLGGKLKDPAAAGGRDNAKELDVAPVSTGHLEKGKSDDRNDHIHED